MHEAASSALAFSSTIDFDDTQAAIISESEDEGVHPSDSTIASSPKQTQDELSNSVQTKNKPQHPLLVEFDDELDAIDYHPTFADNIQEYMHWHYRLNHASFNTMLNMAKLKQLPKEISSIIKKMDKHHQKPPLCSDCTCAKACRKQWRTKPKKETTKPNNKHLSPGDVVSMDQLVSSTPGLIACLHGGRPTTERYVGSTVFVDQASDFCYIYHHTSLNSEETVKAKLAFEAEAKRHEVTIKHYHADNGLFRSKNFKSALEKAGQTISYAGVGAHHQNSIAEKCIGDLQRRATTLLLHAQRRWPDAINVHLWPYALRCANETRNTTPTKGHDQCPLGRFNGSDITPSYRHQHHFGCPVYVLDKSMQDGEKARKWIDRTRIGINLGPSPKHASSVTLILSLQTGLVSPQFHCSYDDLFESTTGTQARAMPKSHWQYKCGFTSSPPEGDNQHEGAISQSEPTEVTNIINDPDDQTEATPLSETIPTQPYVTR
jgi:transposase InsO family protein